jgi:transposase
MDQMIRIGMDPSKHVFQLHGVNAAEEPILRKKLRRQDLIAFFEKLPPTVVGIEACGGSHHWARLLQSLGHQVKMIAPQFVKPYVKRGKNDAADAEAVCEAMCEAMSRPTMRFGYCQVGIGRRLWQGLGPEHEPQPVPRLPLSG